jgi:DUF1680 family protein
MRPIVLTLIIGLSFLGGSAAKAAAASDKVSDQFVPAPYTDQQIRGILGDRMAVNLEGRLLRVDQQAILGGFQHRPGNQPWIGEHAGKFLHAAANTWLYTHNDRLKSIMDIVAHTLIAAQLPDGYLGTYTDDQRWTSWDVWVHKYDLIGLLSYYQATGYEPSLAASRRIGDLLCRTFGAGPGQLDIIQAGTHMGMAATSVLEPMVDLYRITGDQKYLDFCEYIVHSWDQPNGPHIISSLNAGGSVFHTANGKAYEMMSNLVGLAELYRVTGNPLYLRTIEIAWKDVATHRLYLTGTTSSGEHFTDDQQLPGEEASMVGEGCVTVTWLQLSWELLRLTGEPQYAEELEHTVYNALLGAQDPENGNICYFTPLDGKKNPGPGISCCVSSEPRGISMIPQIAWGARGDGAAVVLYVPGRVNMPTHAGNLEIDVDTRYPAEGSVLLTMHPAHDSRFPLYLRVPRWTAHYTATINGKLFSGRPGEFLTLDREWKSGDQIKIDMDLTTREVPGGPSYPYSVAIARGPQILALDQAVNHGVLDLQAAGPLTTELKLTDAVSALPPRWHGTQAYGFEGEVAGKPQALVLVPFADARTYRVWLLKP